MQDILKHFEFIPQLKQCNNTKNKSIYCQIFPNQSILIGDLSDYKSLEGFYQFAYKKKFYLQGIIEKDQFTDVAIHWSQNLYFEGQLVQNQQKFEGHFFCNNLVKLTVRENTEFSDFDSNTIQLIQSNDHNILQFITIQKNNFKILKVLYRNQCLIKIKSKLAKGKQEIQFGFYQHKEQFQKQSSINFKQPFEFIKKQYDNNKKIKEKIVSFYKGYQRQKEQIGEDFVMTSMTNMKGIKLHFNKNQEIQGYSLPLFDDCIQFGLTVNTFYEQQHDQIKNINVDYNPKEPELQTDDIVCPVNIQRLKYVSDIRNKGFQEQEIVFKKIAKKLCEKYVIIEDAICPQFYCSDQESESSSNLILCSEEYQVSDQINGSNQNSQANCTQNEQLSFEQQQVQMQQQQNIQSQQDIQIINKIEEIQQKSQTIIQLNEDQDTNKNNDQNSKDNNDNKNKQSNIMKIQNQDNKQQQQNKIRKFRDFQLQKNYQYFLNLRFQKGLFKNNRLVGFGIEIFNKYYYNGMFQNGQRHGGGYLVEQDNTDQGDYFQFGYFENNQKCGRFIIQRNSALKKVIIENGRFYDVPKRQKYLGVFRKFYNHKNLDDVLIEGNNFEFYGKFDQIKEQFLEQDNCKLSIYENGFSLDSQCQLLKYTDNKNILLLHDQEQDKFYKIDLEKNELIKYNKQFNQIN